MLGNRKRREAKAVFTIFGDNRVNVEYHYSHISNSESICEQFTDAGSAYGSLSTSSKSDVFIATYLQ